MNDVGAQLRDLIKLGTDPMAGISGVSTRFSLRIENEQADAVRAGRTRLARSILGRERGQGGIHFPCSADHEQDWES